MLELFGNYNKMIILIHAIISDFIKNQENSFGQCFVSIVRDDPWYLLLLLRRVCKCAFFVDYPFLVS